MKLTLKTPVLITTLLALYIPLRAAPDTSVPLDAVSSSVWAKIEAGIPGTGPMIDRKSFEHFWVKRISEFVQNREAEQGAVVFLGDSITAQWDLKSNFPTLKTANHGIPGDTTRGMLLRFNEFVVGLKPPVIVFHGGVNDLFKVKQGASPETVAANMRALLTAIHAHLPATRVIVCETMPCKKSGMDATIVATNRLVDAVVADFPQAQRLVMHDRFLGTDGQLNDSLFRDGTHPSKAGYAEWKAALQPVLEKLPEASSAMKSVQP